MKRGVVIVAAMLALSACAAKRGHPTACSLIPQHDMEKILGGPVAGAVPDDSSPGTSVCTYPPLANGFRFAQVTIDWNSGREGIVGTKLAARAMGREFFQNVRGVGDEAIMIPGGVMSARKGSIHLMIDLRLQPQPVEKATLIANTIFAKLEER